MGTKNITICDATLRDGSHACGHQITLEQIAEYSRRADTAGFDYIEVGHGNGLGASSLQVGESLESDYEMLTTAKKNISTAKLSVHVIPGFATISRELASAIDAGVELFRIGCHCTEADTTQRHIAFAREQGRQAWGVLMMSHMVPADVLLEEARKMESYGAQAVVLMDSAGSYLPQDVENKVGALVQGLSVPVGFHAHNNMGLSISNSITALNSGARIVDGTARGFGAGAGNAPLELLAAVLDGMGFDSKIDLYGALDCGELAAELFSEFLPRTTDLSIVSAMAGVFSGFAKPVKRASENFSVDARDIFFELGRRKVVGGQEDLIFDVAASLSKSGDS